MMDFPVALQQVRNYFDSGATREYAFRREQLLQLKHAILNNEKTIQQALYEDLKKNAEEAWITEIGFVLAEINFALKNLKHWMKPERVKTNLLNFPSKSFIIKEPLGVVLIAGPWNYPFQLLITPLVGAIAGGNCAVIKPSEHAPATCALIKKFIEETFSNQYIMVAKGDGAEVIPAMMSALRFDHVFFTGSTAVGKKIYSMAAENLVPVTLELGGKTPCVVEKDANIRVAAKRIAVTKFSNAGQMCVAPDYVLVHESVKENFVEELKKNIKKFYSDDPFSDYHFGKIINEQHFQRLRNYLNEGDIIYGGNFDADTHQLAPTLMENVPMETAVMGEEIFGPLLPIITFKTFEEAKAVIKKNAEPLAFYVFTENKSIENKWLQEISFGGGCVNNTAWHLTNYHLPFGGKGNSGTGRYHGAYSFDLFTHHKAIMKTPTWIDPAIRYPPFKGKLNIFKRLIR